MALATSRAYQVEAIAMRFVELQIPSLRAADELCDAVPGFVSLHEKLLGLAGFAAEQTAYAVAPPVFVVGKRSVIGPA